MKFLLSAAVLLYEAVLVASSGDSQPQRLLLLDVDNTLYVESEAGIESQIVQNTHSYCQQELGMTAKEADELFATFGSTIEGLRQTTWKDINDELLQQNLKEFYEYMYRDIGTSRLLLAKKNLSSRDGSTGYSHSRDLQLASRLLHACPVPMAIASNSPSWHVKNVLQSLGLCKLDWKKIYTPDRLPGFPTKHLPGIFFANGADAPDTRVVFLDDSMSNLKAAENYFQDIESTHISPTSTLGDALLRHLGLVNPDYNFDATEYLKSKNEVDSQSIHAPTWNRVVSYLRDTVSSEGRVEIVDVGAGRLNILSLLMNGDASSGLAALFAYPKTDMVVSYTAYESNRDLLPSCQENLATLGFELKEQISDDELVYVSENYEVRLCLRDFDAPTDTVSREDISTPHLIVGCCFADLMDPTILVPSLLERFQLLAAPGNQKTLLYFPITFSGTTQFLPPSPFESNDDSSTKSIPSDTYAFHVYSRALESDLGHNLDPGLLQRVFEEYGIYLITKGSSNWKIDPTMNPHLFETMLYFFGTAAGPAILESGFDAAGWIRRAVMNRPKIEVSNVDLLFEVRQERFLEPSNSCKSIDTSSMDEIQFTAPEFVSTIKKDIPDLQRNQILIESSFSLISSGTELKVYKGQFEDAALDVNIKGMEDERMAYPLAYGYCLVGRIVKCGENVPEEHIGKLVFTFSAHASHVVTDIDAVQFVPDDISAEDAIFMPSVETALSLVHDAHVRIGENVAVYGQGLIGLLVTSILKLQSNQTPISGKFGTITTFDTIPDRLAISAKMGATQTLLPGTFEGPFDVAIEVSGNSRALQAAIDSTLDGGRIIVGSWYGNTDVSLKLGMDFHRSHKTIQTSQVSEIPANLRGLWDKKRRFGLTWELVRQLRPSRLLTKTTTLKDADKAYDALDKGSEIAVAFTYNR